MIEYRVRGKYDLWRGVWQIVDSTLPGLAVEAPTYDQFVDEINLACSDDADGREHRVTVAAGRTSFWTLETIFSNNVLVNGRLQTREEAAELKARYEAAS